MPEDDYSDSDDESVGEVETSVYLGVPDGPIDSSSDLADPEVSRIGGKPALLTSKLPANDMSICKICSQKMELLVQIWCPFEDSPLDRSLYVFGCAKAGCQKKDGSLRAWRAVRHNAKYAKKLQKKKESETRTKALKEKEALETAKKATSASANPFTVSSSSAFGDGAGLFGENAFAASTPQPHPPPAEPTGESEEEGSDNEEEPRGDEVSHLGAVLEQTTISNEDHPTYSPIYLSTSAEYVPPPPRRKATEQHAEDNDGDGKSKGGAPWGGEGYEKAANVDDVFQRFTKRVGYEAEQCIRYDLFGIPLAFQTDAVYKKLFPVTASSTLTPTTKAAFVAQSTPPKRNYDPSSLSPCPCCQAARTFECQLMPNLLNVLKAPSQSTAAQSEEARKKELERILLGKRSGQDNDRTGMEWGTCLVFSCEKDCCLDDSGSSVPESWREELVLVQWE